MQASTGDTMAPAALAVPAPLAAPQTAALPASSSTNQCPFLRLPAELRNRIYRYALLTKRAAQHVIVTKETIAQPSLIRACRQIRREAKLIYYLENYFLVDAINFDCSLVKFFFKQVDGHWSNYDDLPYKKNVRYRVTFDFGGSNIGGPLGLANVMTWLRAFSDDAVPALRCIWCDGTEICCAASMMCTVVSEASCLLPWKDLEPIIAIVKETGEKQADGRWTWGGDDDDDSAAEGEE